MLDGVDDVEPEQRPALERALQARREPTILLARHSGASVVLGDLTVLLIDAPAPTFTERDAAWRHHAGPGAAECRDVAAKFRLSVDQIAEGAAVARLAARSRGETAPTHADLDFGARQASSSRLGELATRLQPVHTWDSIVLPDRERGHLASIAAHLRHRDRVLSSGDTRRPSPAATASRRSSPASRAPARRWPPGDRRRPRPRAVPRRPRRRSSPSTSGRRRRTWIGSSPRPKAPTRSSSSTRPTRCSASARRSATRTTVTPTSRSPTCCRRWRATRAASCSPRTSSATSTTPSCAAWTT